MPPQLSPKTGNRYVRAGLSAIILFHIVVILSWAVPLNSLLLPALNNAVGPYMQWSGLYQAWDMFSPNPATDNSYLDAEVTLRSGQTRLWKFPIMHELGYFDRYVKERYRKWASDRVRMDANSALWPDAARYIAWQFKESPDPPVRVKLIRHWSFIPPPPPPGQPEQQGPWQQYTFFTYEVKPEDML